ncbi:hypothetical protein DSUL_20330 [Desulfovibrionales bacterium]
MFEIFNFNRQFLCILDWLGQPKTVAARVWVRVVTLRWGWSHRKRF